MSDKGKGKIYIGGTLCFGGPKIAERLRAGEKIYFENDLCIEMGLSVEPRLKDQVAKLEPWFSIDCAAVEIKTEADFQAGDLCITFTDGSNRTLGLRINLKQAYTLQDLLGNFVQGASAAEYLTRTHRVEAPDEKEENEPAAARPS